MDKKKKYSNTLYDKLRLDIYARTCRTAIISAAGIATIFSKYAVEHSERFYSAIYVFVFGKMPP